MDTENGLITGSQIHLGDVVFNVVRLLEYTLKYRDTNARTQVLAEGITSISGNVINMISKSSSCLFPMKGCQINDYSGSSLSAGTIRIFPNTLVGLLPTHDVVDVFNLAQIDGQRRSYDINVIGVYSRRDPTVISSGLSCTSSRLRQMLQVESDCSSFLR